MNNVIASARPSPVSNFGVNVFHKKLCVLVLLFSKAESLQNRLFWLIRHFWQIKCTTCFAGQ